MICLKCRYSSKNTFGDRKEMRLKIKERMVICPNCGNDKKFEVKDGVASV